LIFFDGREGSEEYIGRLPTIKPFGNWLLGLYELYLRNPHAERFAMFQDDLVTYKNLRQYLKKCEYPSSGKIVRSNILVPPGKGYWNLFTFTSTVDKAKNEKSNEELRPSEDYQGFYESNQRGRGAVALVFDKQAVMTLLSSHLLVEHPQDVHRGFKRIDGIVLDCLSAAGYKEYVHWPSLVQHTGELSTIGNTPQPQATSFRGEDFDALDLLKKLEDEPMTYGTRTDTLPQ